MGIGEWIALGSSIATLIDFMHRPPKPHCPKCGIPMDNPGTRYSRCIKCGQRIDWYMKDGKGSR
jgi:tRNA(Ile2) C34 agmatinyltransferase TiaS